MESSFNHRGFKVILYKQSLSVNGSGFVYLGHSASRDEAVKLIDTIYDAMIEKCQKEAAKTVSDKIYKLLS